MSVRRGVGELRRLLREQTFDLRGLNVPAFRLWLDAHRARWQADPLFIQRTRVHDLRRAHPRLRELEEELRRASVADEASPESARIDQIGQEVYDTDQAIAGLTAALERAAPEKGASLRAKLAAFEARRAALLDEQTRLLDSSLLRQARLAIYDELQQFRAAIGLDRVEAHLHQLMRRQGRRSGQAGDSFEELALTLTRDHIIPDLLRGNRTAAADVRVLTGVTLGTGRVELDQVVIRQPGGAAAPVEVLAVVEAKRNINDLGHGFRGRQENLGWLTGDSGQYDPEWYRTSRFRSGHFDREAAHRQDGESYLFTRASFRRFRRDPITGLILRRLYFVTRAGPLWGASAATLNIISFRVATDERWEPGSDSYLLGLKRWCQGVTSSVEAPDVLRAYAVVPQRGRQILLVQPRPAGERAAPDDTILA